MRAFFAVLKVNLLLFRREPVAMFFALMFPVMLLLLFFPLLFLSGAAIPLSVMPEHIQAFARLLPMTQAVSLIQGR